jgi:N-acetylglucosamine kinase-like BadF-type ATPase
VLFDVAATGDPVANGLVERLASEVAAFVIAAVTRLDWPRQPVPVVLGGAVLAAGHALLDNGIRRRITAAVPRADFIVVTDPPVLGAALLALDAQAGGADREAATTVRRHFDGRRSSARLPG